MRPLTNIYDTFLGEEECSNGDVKVGEDGHPMLFWDGKWSPICGHWFWDNHHGAKSFCKKLGYESGKYLRTNEAYEEDAILIGRCRKGESLEKCTGTMNRYTLDFRMCRAGEKVAITISCDGVTPLSSSCKGMPQLTAPKYLQCYVHLYIIGLIGIPIIFSTFVSHY